MVRRLVALAPVPERAEVFSEVPLTLALGAQVRDVTWLWMDPRGRVEVLKSLPAAPGHSGALANLHAGPGPYVIQVLTETDEGPLVAAQATVLGTAARSTPPPRIAKIAQAADPKRPGDVYQALRLLRSRMGIPAHHASRDMEWLANMRLAQVMRDGRLRHVDAQGQTLVDLHASRVGGPAVSRLAEVLAAGPTLGLAYQSLLASPAHRRQLQDPSFSEAGVAAAHHAGLGEWLMVVALARPVEEASPEAAQAEVLQRLNAERAQRRLPPLSLEPTLAALVQAHARRLAKERALSDVTAEGLNLSDVALRAAKAQRAGVQLYRVGNPKEVSASPTVLDEGYRKTAIGVQAGHGVDGLYVVVVLLEP
jgi:uncharacterized protein YkwD